MQILKRITRKNKKVQNLSTSLRDKGFHLNSQVPTEAISPRTHHFKNAQNLMEFVFIVPILIFLTLAIFEVALFWQNVNSVYSLNTEINANAALIKPAGLSLGSKCPAATKSLQVLESKDSIISMNNPTYTEEIVDGNEPFSLYRYYTAGSTVAGKPQITLWVDCRNPFENGVTTQIEFYHKMLIMKATIPSFTDSDGIVLIPDNVFIASPKLNTIRHY